MRNLLIFWFCIALTLAGIVVFLGISLTHGVMGSEQFGKTCACPEEYQRIPSRVGGEVVGCVVFTPEVNREGKLTSFTYSVTGPLCS